MSRLIRLVATDLDGTLLRPDGSVSARTRSALATAQEAGIQIVPVTGRPLRWMNGIGAATGIRGVAVLANGALEYDLDTQRILTHRLLPGEAAAMLVRAIRQEVPGVVFACELPAGFGHEPGYDRAVFDAAIEARFPAPAEGDALELVRDGVAKLLVRARAVEVPSLAALTARLAGRSATVTFSGDRVVEVSGPGVSKAAAVREICRRAGLTATDVLALDDMPNDADLLRWAGRGVAVANAHPMVLRVADEVTGSNADDGVALVLERLLDGAGRRSRRGLPPA